MKILFAIAILGAACSISVASDPDQGRHDVIANPTGLRGAVHLTLPDDNSTAESNEIPAENESDANDRTALHRRVELQNARHGTYGSMNTTNTNAVMKKPTPIKSSAEKHRTLNIFSDHRWKDRSSGRVVVPYTISSSFSASERGSIRRALDDLEERSGSLNFVQRSNQGHYVQVVRRAGIGCQSNIGKIGGPQQLNLATGCMRQGTIQHEFMHAMGYHHEHTRPDRDQYVTILWENIKDRRAKENNFRRQDTSQTLGSPYDYGSIMHYSSDGFAFTGTDTIVPKNGNQIGQRDKASDTDIKKLKLLHQCERGIVRDWNTLINSPCTSDCKCREGEAGCGSNNDACHDGLVCSNNKCVTGSNPSHCGCNTCTQQVWDSIATDDNGSYTCGSRITWVQSAYGYSETDACSFVTDEFPDVCRCNPTCDDKPPPSPAPAQMQYLVWQSLPGGASDDFRCMDLKARDTTNGNSVWYYPCNFTPAQLWYRDTSTNYIRSSIDMDKCLIGSGGSSEKGTRLIIHDCYNDDDRFRWDKYTDGSMRPRNNKWACIEADINAQEGLGLDLILDGCWDGYKAFNWLEVENSGRRKLLSETNDSANRLENIERSTLVSERNADFGSDEGCEDSPVGWYDIFGRNCAWYGEEESNCAVYGGQYKNFGRTALSACCVCGGGPPHEAAPHGDDVLLDVEDSSQSPSCWNVPDWYDSTGDGCIWYEEESNCEYYGDQCPSSSGGQTANEACCACGGGMAEAMPASSAADEAPGCSDSPFDWFDGVGLGCDWYALEDRNCVEFGDTAGADGLTPNEVCCSCGGGFNPNVLFL